MWEEKLSASLNLSKKIEAAREESEREYAAEIKKIEDKEKELLSRIRELEEEKLKAATKYGSVDDVSDDDLVEINAGGRIIALQRGLCCQDKLNTFGMLFGGRWEKRLPLDDNGRVFFDVNPEAIQYFVDELYEQAISSPGQLQTEEAIINRYERQRALGRHIYQQINFLDTLWKKRESFESNIPSHLFENDTESDDHPCIGDFLRMQGLGGAESNLLYRGSRDGFSSDNFHSNCDNKGHTLVIIETDRGLVGGYTDAEWGKEESQMDQKHACANKSFLFALWLRECFPVTWKSDLKSDNDNCVISTHKDFGPVFGDIDVGADLSVQGRTVTLNLGGNYERKYEHMTREHGNYFIKEIEVFQISQEERKKLDFWARMKRCIVPADDPLPIDRFATAVNDAMNGKWRLLRGLERSITLHEDIIVGEKHIIESLSMMKGSNEDIISLNVSGTIMTTTRATLRIVEDSVLAQQFDDTKWTEQGHNNPRANKWTQEEVLTWVRSLKDVPDDVAQLFRNNEIKGSELLALNEFGLKEMGVERVGTICLLMKEIKQLEKSTQDVYTHIEHSPYCFGKIFDFLRLKRFHSLNLLDEEPDLPEINKLQRKRFEKIVNYYFPGDCAELLLGPSYDEED